MEITTSGRLQEVFFILSKHEPNKKFLDNTVSKRVDRINLMRLKENFSPHKSDLVNSCFY